MDKQIDGIIVYKQPHPLKAYTYVAYSHGKLFVRGIDENDRRVMFYSDYQPTVWVPLHFDYTEYKHDIVDVQFNKWKTLIGEQPLVGLTFKSIYACNQFIRKNTTISRNAVGALVRDTQVHISPSNHIVSQYIAENFPQELHVNAEQLRILSYDIETEVGHRLTTDDKPIQIQNKNTQQTKQTTISEFEDIYNDGNWLIWSDNVNNWVKYDDHPYRFIGNFPDPLKADEKIILITVKDINNNRIDTWGLNEFENKRDDVVYHYCKDETQLLNEFVDFIVADYPDAITGWNCLEKTSTVWMNDRIKKISDIQPNDRLVDSNVVRVSDITSKDEYVVTNILNQSISCSKDHIFPCYVIDKNRYTNFTPRYNNLVDLSVSDMMVNRANGREVFVVIPKHNNTNKDYTYRDYCLDVCEKLFDNYKFFDCDNNRIDTIERLIDVINNSRTITCAFNKVNRKTINLEESIDDDFCHLLGLIYTDGTYDKRENQFAFYSSNVGLINRVNDVVYRLKSSPQANSNAIMGPYKNNYFLRVAMSNRFGFLKSMIYDNDNNKRLNVELLSRLSSRQFHHFLSGLIDGDGWVSRTKNYNGTYSTNVGWCNYNDDVKPLQELLAWNGYIVSTNKAKTQLLFKSFQHPKLQTQLDLWTRYKKDNLQKARNVSCHSCKSRAFETNLKIVDIDNQQYFIVRVDKIENTGNRVEMIDIETDTHYFYTQGIKTHNCSVFDNTYVANRVKSVLGEEKMKLLSPIREINFKQVEHNEFGKSIVETSWLGISDLDYLRLYKKYTYGNRESYKLDAIAESEIKVKKVPNPIDGSFKEFYTGKFDVRSKPTTDDNEIKKLGWIRTQLRKQVAIDDSLLSKFKAIDEKIVQMCKQLFIEYNIRDVELVDKIDKKQKFITLAMTIAYLAHCNYEDVFSPVKTWDYTIYNTLLADNKVIPIKKGGEKSERFPGAYVKEPLKGKHEFCESFDLDSLLTP